MKFVALFLLAASCLAQEAREPVRPIHHPIPAYPACGELAVVGEPCIWQPPNVPMKGDFALNYNGTRHPTRRDAWVYIERTVPDQSVVMQVSFGITVQYWRGNDCLSVDGQGMEIATLLCTQSCSGAGPNLEPVVCNYGDGVPRPGWWP